MDKEEFRKSCQNHARRQAATRLKITIEEYDDKLKAGLKWCGGCIGWVPLLEFSKDKSRPSGYCSKCKTCQSNRCVTYWVEIRSDPTRLEQKRSRERRTGRRSSTKYTRNIPRIPKAIRELRWEEYEGKCAYCGNDADTFDHIIPVAKGGTNEAWNIAPTCRSCNSSKQDANLFEWIDKFNKNPSWMLWEQIANWISCKIIAKS